MVRDLPYFIQFTMVAGESVDTQVRVRFPAWWVRDVIRGGSVGRGQSYFEMNYMW